MRKIQTHTFPNGFRVIHEHPVYKKDITYVDVFCRVGSVNETDTTRGVSHFIEHMCFKGTRKLPKTRDIFEVYDDVGGYFNAYTERQYTCYVATFPDAHVQHCVSTLSDMLLNSAFHKNEYEKELNVVIEENNNPSNNDIVENLTKSLLYKGSAYAYPVDSIKYHKIVDSWKYDEVLAFYHKYYVPENMLISIVSSHSFDTILKMLQKTDFIKLRKQISPSISITSRMIINTQHGLHVQRLVSHTVENVYISWGIRTCSIFSDDVPILKLLRNIIGGSFTSRLNLLLREKHGLTYASDVSAVFYEHSGDIIISTVTNPKTLLKPPSRIMTRKATPVFSRKTNHRHMSLSKNAFLSKGVLPLIADMIRGLVHHGVSQRELIHAKKNVEGALRLAMETSTAQVDHNGMRAFLQNEDQIIPYDQLYDTQFAPITRKQINAIIRKYFTLDNTNISFYGNKLPSQTELEAECSRAFRP